MCDNLDVTGCYTGIEIKVGITSSCQESMGPLCTAHPDLSLEGGQAEWFCGWAEVRRFSIAERQQLYPRPDRSHHRPLVDENSWDSRGFHSYYPVSMSQSLFLSSQDYFAPAEIVSFFMCKETEL